jgi:hypothetical protein
MTGIQSLLSRAVVNLMRFVTPRARRRDSCACSVLLYYLLQFSSNNDSPIHHTSGVECVNHGAWTNRWQTAQTKRNCCIIQEADPRHAPNAILAIRPFPDRRFLEAATLSSQAFPGPSRLSHAVPATIVNPRRSRPASEDSGADCPRSVSPKWTTAPSNPATPDAFAPAALAPPEVAGARDLNLIRAGARTGRGPSQMQDSGPTSISSSRDRSSRAKRPNDSRGRTRPSQSPPASAATRTQGRLSGPQRHPSGMTARPVQKTESGAPLSARTSPKVRAGGSGRTVRVVDRSQAGGPLDPQEPPPEAAQPRAGARPRGRGTRAR